jgi:putative drug exporter of the RND superfamily
VNAIIKGKWFVIIAWIAIVAGLFMTAPNMADLVREKGQVDVPEEYSSALATKIMNDVQKQEGNGDETQVALVFHENKKLTIEEISEAEKAVNILEKQKQKLGITQILTHFKEESLKKQLVSDDGKSILVSLSVSWNDRGATEVSEDLYEIIDNIDVGHFYTSNWMINEDLTKSSEEGLKKTEGITVIFILGVLLLVFRSVVAPFIPLLTVGITYLASQSIVSMLVDTFNFPISNYTQIFLVAVLFGIGTDYCILLLSRFKEELSKTKSNTKAIVKTYRNAGRTVFFSGVAVMIGFAAIGFSQFKLYQSASAVAVGVAILLIALFTIVPFFMAILGQKIFWPSKSKAEHGESNIWGIAGKFSLSRPFLSLLIVAVVCVPFLVSYDGKLSFNSLEEVSGDVPSIKAFDAIADSFGPGESMPTQVVIKNDERMDSAVYIELAEKMSQELEKVDLVENVRSITRPTGEPINDFFVSNQAESLEEGLGEGKEGINRIGKGLNEASNQLSQSGPGLKEATSGINELISGTDDIQTNLIKIENGIRQSSIGSGELKKGLEQAKIGANDLLINYNKMLEGYEVTVLEIRNLEVKYTEIENEINDLSEELSKINTNDFKSLEEKYLGLAKDEKYVQLKTSYQTLQKKLPAVSNKLNEFNQALAQISIGLGEANTGFKQSLTGQQRIVSGLEELIKGIEKQQAGLNQLADGQGIIVDNVPKLTNGLAGITDGQQKLLNGFDGLGDQLNQLTTGLGESSKGLNRVSKGLDSAQEYLAGVSDSSDMNGFYLPDQVLESKEFNEAMNAYMSKDRKVMTLDVVFNASPYSNEAIDQVKDIKDAVKRVTKDTKLENADVAVGGITSTNADLETMSGQDYSRTVVLMLVGISIILVFLFRSIIMPIYIIGSLILTYYTSMAINEVIYVDIFNYTGISWAVPFFGFVILVALGVDYSIFLMDRFNEYKELSVADAMLLAMKKMGTVIISAVIILGGTFAAMMPSGMLSLLQIASIILIGLLLYAFIILPLFIPVMVKNFGQANWWPFKRVSN